jgi:hypothetical protein
LLASVRPSCTSIATYAVIFGGRDRAAAYTAWMPPVGKLQTAEGINLTLQAGYLFASLAASGAMG